MQKQIIYPGTFDPITNGHIDLIERACKLFDQVIVAIAASANKSTLFSLAERKNLASLALKKYKRVKICTFSGLLIDFARVQKTNVVLRGLRTMSDFEHEWQLANTNHAMEPKFETIFLTPTSKYAYISASIIREIALMGGDVSAFVPTVIQKALYNKYIIISGNTNKKQ
jgi:pantetheine-phosphate adenylyltransferase